MKTRRKAGLLMMASVGGVLLLCLPAYLAITTRESLLINLLGGLMYGGLPLALAGIAWQHPVPGSAVAIGYSILAMVLEGIRYSTPVGLPPLYYVYLALMIIFLIGGVMVLISRGNSNSSALPTKDKEEPS